MKKSTNYLPPQPADIRNELATLLARGILRLHARPQLERSGLDSTQPLALPKTSAETLDISQFSRLNSRHSHGSL